MQAAGPCLILSTALTYWGPPRLCSRPVHLSPTHDCVPRSEVLGTPLVAGVMSPSGPLVDHLSFCPVL